MFTCLTAVVLLVICHNCFSASWLYCRFVASFFRRHCSFILCITSSIQSWTFFSLYDDTNALISSLVHFVPGAIFVTWCRNTCTDEAPVPRSVPDYYFLTWCPCPGTVHVSKFLWARLFRLMPASEHRVWAPIAHFGKYHNILCLSPQILHEHCFQFPLGLTMVPRENKNNAYSKFGGTN